MGLRILSIPSCYRLNAKVLQQVMTFSERGQVHRALHDAKGRERPRVAFRAAGRAKRGGRSRPFDVLARAPALRSCPRICLCSQGLQNQRQKTDQKTVRKTDFRTVFHHFDGCIRIDWQGCCQNFGAFATSKGSFRTECCNETIWPFSSVKERKRSRAMPQATGTSRIPSQEAASKPQRSVSVASHFAQFILFPKIALRR
jgi:hypothetical protein